ncbi:GTP-binding protein [Acidianus sulfidivorans JP7]|uniref:GTP-binding protein n=1 Tax=Acidianus sulfidivorans JP7 TaxID=619593 RepID=A0A2U9INI6_9CREN|nr:GTPase [Acidianus sulfidivorans]AWR97562.1 GTP-binding protein [Acidianus sulfidivorans JP7]
MLNIFQKIKCPPKVEDLIKIELNQLPKIQGNTIKDREIRRLKSYSDLIQRYIDFVKSFPKLDDLHPFYKEAIEIYAGKSLGEIKNYLAITNRASLNAIIILKKYIALIKKSDESVSNKLMRQGFGRASSILRQKKEYIDCLIDLAKTLKKMKYIDPDLPTIIVSGAPNVGKSTLVTKISSGKPEIANYPFTTKDIHVGHFRIKDTQVQVIDTPGILDRPDSQRNQIERKAINALKNLKGIVIFMFDVSKEALYTPEEQINIFKDTLSLSKKTIQVINKIDEINKDYYDKIVEYLNKNNLSFIEISAEKELGIDKLKEKISEILQEEYELI